MSQLKEFAQEIRIEQIKCFAKRGFGHVGGSLSATDCIAALYGKLMKYDANNPKWQGRDRLVCSKGHSGPALYAALAIKGFFPKDWLDTLNQHYTRLPSHCDRLKTPGIDMTTGSLGQGCSLAAGMAIALLLDGGGQSVYLIMGDGECDEGQVWEMALFAGANKLHNLVAFVDYNHKQLDGTTEDVLDLGDIAKKFESFGWHAVSVDGNDPDMIVHAVQEEKGTGKPLLVVLNTVKGAGVKAIEEMEFNHHITIDENLARTAMAQLEGVQGGKS